MKTHEVCTTNKHIPYCGQSLCQQPKPVGFFTMEETPEMVEGAFYFFQPPKANLVVHVFKKLEETIFITEGKLSFIYIVAFLPGKNQWKKGSL